MRFLKPSAVGLSAGGATRSQFQDCENTFRVWVTPLGGQVAQLAAVLTRSGVYSTSGRSALR